MKHFSKIQKEFVKEASQWNDMSLEEQKASLKQHPASKRRITAKPKNDKTLKEKLKDKKQKVTNDKQVKPKYDVNKLSSSKISRLIYNEFGGGVDSSEYHSKDSKLTDYFSIGGERYKQLPEVVKKLFGKSDRFEFENEKQHPTNKVVGMKVWIKDDPKAKVNQQKALEEGSPERQAAEKKVNEMVDNFKKDGFDTSVEWDKGLEQYGINVTNKKGFDMCFWYKSDEDKYDCIVQGYRDDISLCDIGTTYKELKEMAEGINISWIKEYDPEAEQW